MFPTKESPSIRDMFAINIAGVMLSKSDLKIDNDDMWRRKISFHDDVTLRAVAYVAYQLADKMMEERAKKD